MKFGQTLLKVIDKLSFNEKIRDLVILLNQKIEHSEIFSPHFVSHPGGFVREFYKRRIGIAESYVTISRQLDTGDHEKRLNALGTLVELSFHSKTMSLPVNTARVQIELMKEAVKNQGNKRKMMECLADFAVASFGQESVIRKFLKERRLIQVPETGKPLKELSLGWDCHVHDNLSEGRKTPSQVVVDAFIKGLSKITVVYYDISNREIVTEAMEAGAILGIDVNIGIEFSTGPRYKRKHFMFIPPASTPEEFYKFFEVNSSNLTYFLDGLEENRKRRNETTKEIVEHFNRVDLKKINDGYERDLVCAMEPLSLEDLQEIVIGGHYTRIHLGQLVFVRYREVLRKRVLSLKLQYEVSNKLFEQGRLTEWELNSLKEKYFSLRRYYQRLTPDDIMSEFIEGKSIIDYDSAFESESSILPALKKSGGKIVYIHPLADGLETAISTLVCNHEYIDEVELINMYDSVKRTPGEIISLANAVAVFNAGKKDEILEIFKDKEISCPDEKMLDKVIEHYRKNPLIPVAGSDSTGREPHIPGMGFIRESDIPRASKKWFIKSHYKLPVPVGRLIASGGRKVPESEKDSEKYSIYSMGKSAQFQLNLVGDEENLEKIGLLRFWRYLNPFLKKLLRVIVAMVPATLQIGPVYMAIWLGITFIRNVFVDLISASGTKVSEWHSKDINFDFVTQSVFWTGFSVPILASVKHGFDLAWPLEHEGPLFEWCKFFFICFTNGLYISTHNRLRGFETAIIRANFFRSVLAWPFASVFAPLGNFLMIPSIVQAKIWSDVVAGVIEGTGKFRQRLKLRKRDLQEILPKLESSKKEERFIAMLDILYIWARQNRGRTALEQILLGKRGIIDRFLGIFKKKKNSETGVLSREELIRRVVGMVELFNPQRCMSEISHFILCHYRDREGVILTDLVGTNLAEFYDWLKKIQKKLSPNK